MALLVCGNLHFDGLPWGSLSQVLRDKLRNAEGIEDVATRIKNELEDLGTFTEEARPRSWTQNVSNFILECIYRVEDWVISADGGGGSFDGHQASVRGTPTPELVLRAGREILSELRAEYSGKAGLRVDFIEIDKLAKSESFHVDAILEKTFSDQGRVDPDVLDELRMILAEYSLSVPSVTLVVTGYANAREFYPSSVVLHVYNYDGRQLKIDVMKAKTVRSPGESFIIPVGQCEEIDAFRHGVHPDLIPELGKKQSAEVSQLVESLVVTIMGSDNINDFPDLKRTLLDRIASAFVTLNSSWREQWDNSANKLEVQTLKGLAMLPKQGLAEAADVLLGQAILRRTLTVDAEQSIGGLVEVALVSREGGFDLIKSPRMARVPVPRIG